VLLLRRLLLLLVVVISISSEMLLPRSKRGLKLLLRSRL
jgi:hypothetical protein